ncbi:MAG: class I SAM-dependent methyltransferase, partial [Candidatus Eremiobacteraeota bacterium]|nr:class I SAM-dependent methyltransferase [Candidatus Eremiobacteraeota bacterium]
AIDAVLEGLGDPQRLTIADFGAGTGISARLFAERGAAVIAVEPNAAMRDAACPHPRVRWRAGTAERSGLADGSVDLVVACQAFHWFATAETMHEIARIARRRAALLQYERDERDTFTKAYGDIVRAYARDDTESRRAVALATFARFPNARVIRAEFPSAQTLDLEALLGRAASASYLPTSGPDGEALQRELRAVFERFQRDGRVAHALVTVALTADFDR